jgi:hypothetical protein
MEITRLQKFLLSGGDPPLARLSLTFGTVAITARVIGDGLVAATSREMDSVSMMMMKLLPCARKMSATSTVGRVILLFSFVD